MVHPYRTLPEKAFWRSAVAERDMFALEGVWAPKFELTSQTAIATAGSCFAQHIGRHLVNRGFNWLNAEPAPEFLTHQQRLRFNYDLFTFRTGNIYTTPLLRQWLAWGLENATPPDEIWEEDGRFFDPFRPAIEPEGFASTDELLQSRANVLNRMAATLAKTECFVFTLGLTEAWVNAEGGYVYPTCPGTVRGVFDPARHVFRNFDYLETYEAMDRAIALVRRINPALKVILTVSPVPLTATASGQHVLVANTQSKSVLRAVAGALAAGDAGIDYFPSYELITSFATRGMLFEPNLRSVSSFGVQQVMDRFFTAVAPAAVEGFQRPFTAPMDGADPEDVACEDALLASFDASRIPAPR